MRRLFWGLAMVVIFAAALAFTMSRRADAGGQAFSSLLGVNGEESSQPAMEDTSVIVRRLYEGPAPDTWGTDISPDGRYLTQTDWDTGDLAILDLLTGQKRRITNKGSWEDSNAYSEMSVYSPDGGEIAYLWMNKDIEYEIRLIGVDGSNPRVVLPADPERWDWMGLLDWSPDGEHLLVIPYRDLDSELALLSIRDGSLKVLLDPPVGMAVDFGAFSPDGRFIAFDQPSRPTSGEEMIPDGDIYLIPVDGGERVPLLRGPGSDELLGWEPDGRSILFSSDRDLTEGVWRFPVIDGRVAGEPELIKRDLWRLHRIGMAEGRVYYGHLTELPQLYTAGIDLVNGRLVSPPTPVEETPERLMVSPAWSPDGSQLAYARARSPGANSNVRDLVVRSLPGDPPRIMHLPVRVVQKLWWAPDGRSLVLASPAPSWEDPDWRGLFHFDLETGSCSPIETSEGVPWWAALSSDLKVAYYDHWLHHPNVLVARNLETGEEREIVRLESRFSGLVEFQGFPALSPDEEWVAMFVMSPDDPEMRGVVIISTKSGEVRELHRHEYPTRRDRQCGNLLWSPDGGSLLYGVANPASDGCTLQRLSIEDGESTPIAELPAHNMNQLHPEGTRIAFRHGEWRGEIWVMEYGRIEER